MFQVQDTVISPMVRLFGNCFPKLSFQCLDYGMQSRGVHIMSDPLELSQKVLINHIQENTFNFHIHIYEKLKNSDKWNEFQTVSL